MSVTTRWPRLRCSRSCWKAASACAVSWRPSASGPALVGVRVELARRLQRGRADREARVEQRGEAGEAGGEVAVRVLDLGVEVGLPVGADEARELAAELVGLGGDLARLGQERIGRVREPAERADRVLEQHARARPRRSGSRSSSSVGFCERRDRHLRGRERGQQRRVERQPLHRVRVVADHVEDPSEPARAELRVERADLPVVARGEVRLVGVRVADRREDGQLAPGRAASRTAQRRVPVQAGVALEAAGRRRA